MALPMERAGATRNLVNTQLRTKRGSEKNYVRDQLGKNNRRDWIQTVEQRWDMDPKFQTQRKEIRTREDMVAITARRLTEGQ